MTVFVFSLDYSKIMLIFTFTFTFMHLADAFIQSDLQCIQGYTFLVSTCVPWESKSGIVLFSLKLQ